MKARNFLALVLVLALAMTLLPTVALGAELPKLPTPTNLEWGIQSDGSILCGCAHWQMERHLGTVRVCYYRVGTSAPVYRFEWVAIEPERLEMDDYMFINRSEELTNGAYYFTIQILGDDTTWDDSEVARSGIWSYTKPTAKLPTPSAPVFLSQWTGEDFWYESAAFIRWEKPAHEVKSGYEARYYFSATDADATDAASLEYVGGTNNDTTDTSESGLISGLPLQYAQYTGPGYYYAEVRSLSLDITKAQSSDWSPLSTFFYWDGVAPSAKPSASPSVAPSVAPSSRPSAQPSAKPSTQPSSTPSARPSTQPSTKPSASPSARPSTQPSTKPSTAPSAKPSESPKPSTAPSAKPSESPKPVAVTGVSVAKTASVQVGKTKTLTATVKPSNADNQSVTWTSDDTYVVSVDTDGTITGVKTGTANVTVTTVDGGFSASCAVTVTKATISGGGGGGGSSSGGSSGGGATAKPSAQPSAAPSAQPSDKPINTTKPASESFSDVVKGSWYESGVTYVVQKGLFNGVADKTFAPQQNMTRAMLVTVLARLDGQDTEGGATWYAKGTDWAKKNGVSDGTMLDQSVTREQMVTMLYRYAKAKAGTADLSKFADGGKVSDWAKEAMAWAVEQGILTGKDGSRLDPQGTATRAEVATILQRFVEKK